METVGLVVGGDGGDILQEEGVECHLMAGGEFGIKSIELAIIGAAEIARGAHAGEEDGDFGRFEPADDGVEILPGLFRWQGAQGVVGAKFENHQVRLVGQGPVEAGEAAGAGIAGDAGIDDAHVVAKILERRLQLRRKGFFRGETVAGDETVAQDQNPQRFPGRGRDRAESRPQQQPQQPNPEQEYFHEP